MHELMTQIGGDINEWTQEIIDTLTQKNKEPKQIMLEFLYSVCNHKNGRKQLKKFVNDDITDLFLSVNNIPYLQCHFLYLFFCFLFYFLFFVFFLFVFLGNVTCKTTYKKRHTKKN